MSTLSSANVTDCNLVLKERTHMRLCLNMLIFTHNLGNWLIIIIIRLQNSIIVTFYCTCYTGTVTSFLHNNNNNKALIS